MKFLIQIFIAIIYFIATQSNAQLNAQQSVDIQPNILIVQPIVTQSDNGTDPASIALPEELVDRAYEKAAVDFHFLEPIYFNNTKARDGIINLDEIVKIAQNQGLLKGQGDIANMFFVNAIDGKSGPLGMGMMGGNITFIALGDSTTMDADELKSMQAFVISHEVGHNLSLKHAIDDYNVPDSIPNIMGDGKFQDRIDPKYSLNDYQIKSILNSPLVHPRIEFLSEETGAKAILDESFEPYFSQLQNREIEAFTGKKTPSNNLMRNRVLAKELFANAVTNFTDGEKECIEFVTNEVIEVLFKHNITLMGKHPWRFIKIEDWLCGGFAHTRGTFIILSQRHINYLSEGWSKNMTPQEKTNLVAKFGSLIVHEQMHSLQRTFKSKFTDLYVNYWNFVHANIIQEEEISKNQVSNPDAPVAEWIVPCPKEKNTFIWARTLLKKRTGIPVMGKDFEDIAFTVQLEKGKYKPKKNINGTLVSKPLSQIDFYTNAYPVTRGLDHPNEISAYMFADYFKALVLGNAPFSDIEPTAKSNAEAFIAWINEEMKN